MPARIREERVDGGGVAEHVSGHEAENRVVDFAVLRDVSVVPAPSGVSSRSSGRRRGVTGRQSASPSWRGLLFLHSNVIVPLPPCSRQRGAGIAGEDLHALTSDRHVG